MRTAVNVLADQLAEAKCLAADLQEALDLRLVEKDLLIEERDSLVSRIAVLEGTREADNSLVNVILAHDNRIMREALTRIAASHRVSFDRDLARDALAIVGR